MSETNQLMNQQQDLMVLQGVHQYAELPGWLASARNSVRVGRALTASVPEFCNEFWVLKDCDVGHIRFKSEFWTALYHLTVRRPGTDEDERIELQGRVFPPGKLTQAEVQGRLGQEGWVAILPELNLELRSREPEVVLGALGFLTDPEQSRQFLESSIRHDTPALSDLKIKACAPKVVRYKPGSRCTVVYHLSYEDGQAQSQDWPELVVAKTYRGEKGKNAFDSMAALWNAPLMRGRVVKVAQPLAYLPDLKVLVQGPIQEEQTLKDLIYQAIQTQSAQVLEQLNMFMRQTAVGLAALHHSEVKLGRVWVWNDEMSEVRSQVDRLAETLPDLRTAAAPLLNRLNTLAAQTPADRLIPVHGTFRPAQVLLHQGEIGFIDFDSFCQSEPANDLALFLGTVMAICMTPGASDDDSMEISANGELLSPLSRQERYDFGAALCETFLQVYEKEHPVSRRRVALWQALDTFMFVLHGWTKIKVSEIEDIVFLLEQYLAAQGLVEVA